MSVGDGGGGIGDGDVSMGDDDMAIGDGDVTIGEQRLTSRPSSVADGAVICSNSRRCLSEAGGAHVFRSAPNSFQAVVPSA